MSDKMNELIGTTWDYQGVVGTNDYNPQHAGRWKVTGVSDDGRRVIIKQNCCEVAGKPGSRFYVEYASKKCMEIPITELQDNFKLYKEQNIIVEPKDLTKKQLDSYFVKNECKYAKKDAKSCVMTNKDIVKTLDDKKTKAWTDDDIEAYLAQKGIKYSTGKGECVEKCEAKCNKDEISAEKVVTLFKKMMDFTFGESAGNRFLELMRQGSKLAGLAIDAPKNTDDCTSEFVRDFRRAKRDYEMARSAFVRSVGDKECCSKIRPCPSGYENDGPCRHQLDSTPEPRCSNFECENYEKKPRHKIPLKHRKPFNLY